MSNLRKHQRTNFTVLSNEVITDTNLSYRARGIAAYLLSKPDDWAIRLDQLAQAGSEGKAAVRNALKELATAGYLKRERINGKGGLVSTVTHLADFPAFIDDGTPDSRINGYEVIAQPDKAEPSPPTSQKTDVQETDMSETDMSVNRTSVDRSSETWEVIINTDLPNTDLPITEDKGSASAGADGPPPLAPSAELSEDPDNNFEAVFGPGTCDYNPPADATSQPRTVAWGTPLNQMPPHQALYVAVLDAVGWDRATLTERDRGQVAQTCRILRDAGYNWADVGEFMQQIWFVDWRWEKNHSRPTLSQLRQEIGKIKAGVPAETPRRQTKGGDAVDRFFERLEREGMNS